MKNETIILRGTNRRGREVIKSVEILARNAEGVPTRIKQRRKNKLSLYMYVNMFGDCTSVNYGKGYKVYDSCFFVKAPCKVEA
jgi:hypothetical protein